MIKVEDQRCLSNLAYSYSRIIFNSTIFNKDYFLKKLLKLLLLLHIEAIQVVKKDNHVQLDKNPMKIGLLC